jgi:hypothetical protein
MTIKASGRSALILAAAGMLACFAGVSAATAAAADSTNAVSKSDSPTAGKSTKQSSRHAKRDEGRKSDKAASKSSDAKKPADGDAADAATPSAIPPAVANANAQLTGAPADNASAMTAKANTLLTEADKPADPQAEDTLVVASDQFNDLDRELQQSQGSAPTQAQTPLSTQTVAMAPVRVTTAAAPALASSDSSTWDQTSLIGKVFIAFGALLTMASAARMFMT